MVLRHLAQEILFPFSLSDVFLDTHPAQRGVTDDRAPRSLQSDFKLVPTQSHQLRPAHDCSVQKMWLGEEGRLSQLAD
jgi:hypothetical protein